jgi:A/G-specific adenine glycosylase
VEVRTPRADSGDGLQATDLARIRSAILAWYRIGHRDFPWRRTRDPYAVLVSEVMLQQTQASRVAEAFPRFMARFPSAPSLASAMDSAVLAEWSGLGYNRRALALKRAATVVASRGWPDSVFELQELPGVGPYTARALASLAFGQRVGVVDTNVRRWLVRRLGLRGAAGHPRSLQALADALAVAGTGNEGADATAAWTHATMELGAAVCAARAPRCDECPISRGCPSRGRAGRVAVPRQPAYPRSMRAYRGGVLRLLAASARHRLGTNRLLQRLNGCAGIGPQADIPAATRAIAALEREGLVHVVGEVVHLGPPAPAREPTTIGP